MRGRRPQTYEEKALKGFPSNRREMPPPEGFRGPLAKPPWISKGAEAIWDYLHPLARAVKTADSYAFADMCGLWDRLIRLEKRLSREGFVIDGSRSNKVKNPIITIISETRNQLMKYLEQFGMMPVAGTRLGVLGVESGLLKPPEMEEGSGILSGEWKGSSDVPN